MCAWLCVASVGVCMVHVLYVVCMGVSVGVFVVLPAKVIGSFAVS